MADEIIRASEIGQYSYCARAWWFARVRGLRSAGQASLERGARQHRVHGRSVVVYRWLRRVARALLILAAVALLVWVVMALRG